MIKAYEEFTDEEKTQMLSLLLEQGQVSGNLEEKMRNIKYGCVVYIDDKPIACAALKNRTKKPFKLVNANVLELYDDVSLELGYIYVKPEFRRSGVCTDMCNGLLGILRKSVVYATVRANNVGMKKILRNLNFDMYGKPYKSSVADNYVQLFIKYY